MYGGTLEYVAWSAYLSPAKPDAGISMIDGTNQANPTVDLARALRRATVPGGSVVSRRCYSEGTWRAWCV